MGDRLEITLVKSTIGYPKRQDRTVRALGLRKIGQTVTHRDTPAVRGMIRVVRHLVEVVERPEKKPRASRRAK
ncbi:MAG TPA: 50S ribosomal protein L30, partial [Clostridiales bacterium]|nr:50S ribosomal protein L30 [Clostridiales bacterium]